MGKPTGFLEYARRDETARSPLERVGDWNEFRVPLAPARREEQGARCMRYNMRLSTLFVKANLPKPQFLYVFNGFKAH